MSTARDVVHPPRLLAMKRAFRRLVDSVGGVEAAATYCRWSKSQLSDAGNPNTPTFAPVDVIADLEEISRDGPLVSAQMARCAGHVLVPVPDGAASSADYLQVIARIMKENGDVAGVIAAAVADGDVCARDRALALPEVNELLVAVAGLRQLLQAEAC